MLSTPDIPVGATRYRERATNAFDKASIASLSPAAITGLTKEELLDVIRSAEFPPSALRYERLRFLKRPELERMAYIASHCCRLRGY